MNPRSLTHSFNAFRTRMYRCECTDKTNIPSPAASKDDKAEDVSREIPSAGAEPVQIQILVTSDMHGRFMPFDYLKDCEDLSGSLTQIAGAVKELKNDNTVLIDVGDTCHGNLNEIFKNDEVMPMVLGMEELGYEYIVPGNHGFNFGLELMIRTSDSTRCETLCGNVFSPEGEPLGKPYVIVEKSGIKIGIIGMTTPNIKFWDAANLTGWTVTDPVVETQKIIKEIKDKVDVLVAAVHMSIENELSVKNSGVTDYAMACPELDLILASHGHQRIDNLKINNVPIIENASNGRTLGRVFINLSKDKEDWIIDEVSTELIDVKNYNPDAELTEKLKPYDERAKEVAGMTIGVMCGGNLAPDNEIPGIPQAFIQDTALTDLFNRAFLSRTGARVSSINLDKQYGNIYEGEIHRKDIANAYSYDNVIVGVKMNGSQLKKWMEHSVSFYNTFREGDLTVSFNPDIRSFLLDMFDGVNYDVNISREPGQRIENLTWPDGAPVKDEEVFTVLASEYRASSALTVYGDIFTEGEELPAVIDMEYDGKGQDMREVITDYIQKELNGVVTPQCNNNWKLTGISFDKDLRERAVKLAREGRLEIPTVPEKNSINSRSVTEADVLGAENSAEQ